ncbi:hypothetical protein CU098_003705 [Rhizopus stolonifer]|uniref:ERCC4 domain-containing protein n=1 Tax=Rhizopus stolonifer TaxID=4846 RepID=A0A367KA80_RHIST|nr:hypothetical protein CU098_003705 [Rhizopus stolonifer]
MDNIDQLVEQVLNVDSSKSTFDIRKDLEHTKSVELTLNRIFDGEFLRGIKENSGANSALIILDSDEENTTPQITTATTHNDVFDIDNLFSSPDLIEKPKESRKRKTSELFDLFDDPFSSSTKKPRKEVASRRGSISSIGSASEGPFDLFDDTFSRSSSKGPFDLFGDKDKKTTKEKGKEKKEDNSEEEDVFLFDPFDSPKNKGIDLFDGSEDLNLRSSPAKEDTFGFDFDDLDDILAPKEDKVRKDKERESSVDSLVISKNILDSKEDEDEILSPTISGLDDDMIHVPTPDEFFDDLLLLQQDKEIIDIDSITTDRKRKKQTRDGSDSSSRKRSCSVSSLDSMTFLESSASETRNTELTPKEKKKLQAEERKKQREQAAEEKKRKKEERQREREQQALFEKENRVRSNRNEILKEMIVDMHPDFRLQNAGKLLESVLKTKMAQVSSLLDQERNPQYTIAWRRKCNAEWNTDSQAFIPLQNTKITNEPFVLVYMLVNELNELIQTDEIYEHMKKIQQSKKGHQVILLIEGLEPYYKKRALLQKRFFENQVRQAIQDPNASSTGTNRRAKNTENIDSLPSRETVEEHLNELQIMYDIMLVPTKDEEDTASWIESLTTDLALGRYKDKNLNNSYKGIKSGVDPHDTYFKMLQEIQLCTPAVAKSVMTEYPTIQLLHQKYEEINRTKGEMLLSNLEVQRSVLQARDRTINRVMSKKIYTIFSSDDPDLFLY